MKERTCLRVEFHFCWSAEILWTRKGLYILWYALSSFILEAVCCALAGRGGVSRSRAKYQRCSEVNLVFWESMPKRRPVTGYEESHEKGTRGRDFWVGIEDSTELIISSGLNFIEHFEVKTPLYKPAVGMIQAGGSNVDISVIT